MLQVLYLCYLTIRRVDAAGWSEGTVHAHLTEAGVNVASCVNNFALHSLLFPVRQYKREFDLI